MYPNIERYLELVTEDEYSAEPRLDVYINGAGTYTARVADIDIPLLCVHGERYIRTTGDTIQEALANLEKLISETW